MSLYDRQYGYARAQLKELAAARAARPIHPSRGPEVVDAAAAQRIAELERSTLRGKAQTNRDGFQRLDEAALVAKEEFERQMLVSPPDRELIDEGITILDDPTSPVESVLHRTDSPTAVWEFSGWREREIREWGFAWSFASTRSTVPTARWLQGRDRASVYAQHRSYQLNPMLWVSEVLFGTRIVRYHTGVHYPECPASCEESHGMIDIGGSSVVEGHLDRRDISAATDAADTSEVIEELDAPF